MKSNKTSFYSTLPVFDSLWRHNMIFISAEKQPFVYLSIGKFLFFLLWLFHTFLFDFLDQTKWVQRSQIVQNHVKDTYKCSFLDQFDKAYVGQLWVMYFETFMEIKWYIGRRHMTALTAPREFIWQYCLKHSGQVSGLSGLIRAFYYMFLL